MNSNDLYRAIGKVDDDILEKSEAANNPHKAKKRRLSFAAAAACFCLILTGAVIWNQIQAPHTGGVTIPPMEVSLSRSGSELVNMVSFFTYQGRCYVFYDNISDDANIVGEYLGTAIGRIDEWTPEDGYIDFAGSVHGDFYTAKGYDPAFLLCMKTSDGAVSAFICDNGITLKYGSELYEDRLHLSDSLQSVQYESHRSWSNCLDERYQINSVNKIIFNFIKGLDSAQFVLSDEQDSIEDAEELYHLYFQLENGMTIHLRLHENGYVCFQGMRFLYLQVPRRSYNALLDLLDNPDSTAISPLGMQCS